MTWAGVAVSLLFAAVIAVLAWFMFKETRELWHGRQPLTNGFRAVARAYPKTTSGILFGLGVVAGHLFWT